MNIVSGGLGVEERDDGGGDPLADVFEVPFVSWRVGKLLVRSSALGSVSGGGIGSQRAWVGCVILGNCIWFVWISYIPCIFSLRNVERVVLKRLMKLVERVRNWTEREFISVELT